jgi:tRNA pseudouridine38-40 synthase
MPNYKLIVEYDGTRYRGWQTQKNTDRTVAAVLERAATDLFGEPVRLIGAGRTDAGVHARGQVANFHATRRLAGIEIQHGINDRLPSDVNVVEVGETDAAFHARHDALTRTYEYRISRVRTAFEKPFVWWVKDALDADTMKAGAAVFAGDHDFSSFCENPEGQTSTRVRVMRCEVAEEDQKILLRVEASHFLWKMIRRITGTLVEAGRGKLDAGAIRRMLESRTREPARWTAPPSGLFLDRVTYPEPGARRSSPRPERARRPRPASPPPPRRRP